LRESILTSEGADLADNLHLNEEGEENDGEEDGDETDSSVYSELGERKEGTSMFYVHKSRIKEESFAFKFR